MKHIIAVFALAFASIASAQTTSNPLPLAPVPVALNDFYGAGTVFNPGGSPVVAVSAFEAHHLTGDTYTFTDYIIVPVKQVNNQTNPDGSVTTTSQWTATNNIGVGVAVKLFDIGNSGIPVYTTGTGGPSWTGTDTSWQFNYGATVPIRIKKTDYFIFPTVTGVSGGSGTVNGTKITFGIHFGFGK